jgi:acetyl-CoA acyltransferase 1
MNRLEQVSSQVQKTNQKCPNDVVIVAAVRTPLTKAKRGPLKDTAPEYLLSVALRGVVERSGIDPKLVQDIAVGNTLQPGGGAMTARMAEFLAGFPDTTTIMAVNRLCSSGLEACATIASKINAGIIDIGIGSGVESMSCYDMNSSVAVDKLSEAIFEHPQARNCLMGMGETSENVAEKYGVNKEKQNQMAYESHQKAYKAQQSGFFKGRIFGLCR